MKIYLLFAIITILILVLAFLWANKVNSYKAQIIIDAVIISVLFVIYIITGKKPLAFAIFLFLILICTIGILTRITINKIEVKVNKFYNKKYRLPENHHHNDSSSDEYSCKLWHFTIELIFIIAFVLAALDIINI